VLETTVAAVRSVPRGHVIAIIVLILLAVFATLTSTVSG
jgi:hypothetical protein